MEVRRLPPPHLLERHRARQQPDHPDQPGTALRRLRRGHGVHGTRAQLRAHAAAAGRSGRRSGGGHGLRHDGRRGEEPLPVRPAQLLHGARGVGAPFRAHRGRRRLADRGDDRRGRDREGLDDAGEEPWSTPSTTTTSSTTTTTSTSATSGGSTTTSTTRAADACGRRACDDGNRCTLDTCARGGGCRHEPVDLAALRASIDSEFTVDACVGQPAPVLVTALLRQARGQVEQAAHATNLVRARRLLARALQSLRRSGRRASVAARRGRMSASCAAALGAGIRTAEDRGTCLAPLP